MIKLLSKISLMCGLVLVTYLLIILQVRSIGNSRALAAIIDKENLLHTTRSPKVVFVGGSSAALGIDSPQLGSRLGLPVVNMGLHGGLGLRFMLNQVKPYLGAGDVVIVSPEYQSFFGLLDGDETIFDVLYFYPDAVRYVEPRQFLMLAPRLPLSLQVQFQGIASNTFLKADDPVFYREGFNRNGDVISHLNRVSTIDLAGKHLFATAVAFDRETIRVLEDFNSFATGRGARALFVFPPLPDSAYAENEEYVQQVCNGMSRTSMKVLGRPSDHVFPVNYFFDTLYHLNARGRQARTEKIISHLELANHSTPIGSDCSFDQGIGSLR